MNEKKAIEKETADAFITLYNAETGKSVSIVKHSDDENPDDPDFLCIDSEGNTFNFEITLTEDQPKDIQAALGKSNHRSMEAAKKHRADVKAGKANPLEGVSCLQGNVVKMIVSRIQAKLMKDYGANVALVIRDASPLDWDWDMVIDQIKSQLSLDRNPYDKGIWIISLWKDKIYKVL